MIPSFYTIMTLRSWPFTASMSTYLLLHRQPQNTSVKDISTTLYFQTELVIRYVDKMLCSKNLNHPPLVPRSAHAMQTQATGNLQGSISCETVFIRSHLFHFGVESDCSLLRRATQSDHEPRSPEEYGATGSLITGISLKGLGPSVTRELNFYDRFTALRELEIYAGFGQNRL